VDTWVHPPATRPWSNSIRGSKIQALHLYDSLVQGFRTTRQLALGEERNLRVELSNKGDGHSGVL
jgi:hypothetical protein